MSQERMHCSLGGGPSGTCVVQSFKKENFTTEEWFLLKARSGKKKIKTVCLSHKLYFLNFFEKKQRFCCDPFQVHCNKPPSGDLRIVSKEQFLQSKALPQVEGFPAIILRPGTKICKRCHAKVKQYLGIAEPYENIAVLSSGSSSPDEVQDLFVENAETLRKSPESSASHPFLGEEEVREASGDTPAGKVTGCTQTSESPESHIESSGSVYDALPKSKRAIDNINASLSKIGVSPVTKRKLTQSETYVPSKLQKIEQQYASLMIAGGASNVQRPSFETKIMTALQTKFQNSSGMSDRMSVLSVALSALSRREVLEIFGPLGASEYLIRKTSNLMAEQGLFPTPVPKRGRSLSEETLKLIEAFYNSDRVTYQLPGKKDCIITRVNGEKVPIPKKLILCTLKELHSLFMKENPNVTVSFSKFASLRPKHCILAGSAGTHTVCVCRYHQNFKLMVEGGNFKFFNYQCQTETDFIHSVICEKPTSECYLGGCSQCPGTEQLKDSLMDLFGENLVEEVTFSHWSDKERSFLETVVKPMEEYIELFISSLSELLPHHYIAKKQADHLEGVKKNLKEGEVLVISDFSENYSFLIQDSVQSYYWSNDQATLHPFASYYKENGELKFVGYIVISDCMKHNIQSFYAFQKKFIAFMKTVVPSIKKIIYYSDGAAQQYKNLYNMINQTYHLQDFDIKSEWHFFASYHGKGPCDGLGGQLKCSAARASLMKVLIRTPRELYEWAVARPNSAVRLDFVSIQDVEESKSFLQPRFERALQIQGIRSLHCCIPVSVGELSVRRISYSTKSYFKATEYIRKIPDWKSLEPGDFVAVPFKKNWTLAQISNKEAESNDLLVCLLKRCQDPGPPRSYFFCIPNGFKLSAVSLNDVYAEVTPLFNAQRQVYTLSGNDLDRVMWQVKSAI